MQPRDIVMYITAFLAAVAAFMDALDEYAQAKTVDAEEEREQIDDKVETPDGE